AASYAACAATLAFCASVSEILILSSVAALSELVTLRPFACWYLPRPSRVASSRLPVSSPAYILPAFNIFCAAFIWSPFARKGAGRFGALTDAFVDVDEVFVGLSVEVSFGPEA